MSNHCECGHHRLTHTYTREANIGRCQGLIYNAEIGASEDCPCTEYEEES